MGQDTLLIELIDEALERFAGRDLVTGAEVVDLLLDLRLAVLGPALEELLAAESAATTSG
ncbi:MAG: hypothetical protein M5U14_14135 [Acidimicrobiia bacterium]|nr:hypothetical protein [Acidimicrobiia bacterium]